MAGGERTEFHPNRRVGPRAAVQMQLDTRGSKHASNMTYDPQNSTTTITHHDGSSSTHALPYGAAQSAGASGRIDALITHLKSGRAGDQFV